VEENWELLIRPPYEANIVKKLRINYYNITIVLQIEDSVLL